MASFETRAPLAVRHLPLPNSLDPLPPSFKQGLVPVALCAMLSVISVTVLLGFITFRFISWRRYNTEHVRYNQYIILIYNLLLADLQQSIAFSISFHWLRLDKILAPTGSCFAQAGFLHLGDVASGFFVLAIAMHTWLSVVKGYRMSYRWFVVAILLIWMAALILTILGPAMYGNRFFGRAGAWCWVSAEFENERLYFHYLWIFIFEFGTIAIYGHIVYYLRGRIGRTVNSDTTKISRATKFMVLYPAVYVILTLPIAVGRMVAMAGTETPDIVFCVVGTLLTSCGWIDALLYTLTRRGLVSSELSVGHTTHRQNVTAITANATRPGDDLELQSASKDAATGATRTITIIGGVGNRISGLMNCRRGHSEIREKYDHPDSHYEHSLTGSRDSIVKRVSAISGIEKVTETTIQVDSASSGGNSNDDEFTQGLIQPSDESEKGCNLNSLKEAHCA